jgi:hypothetical protein
VRIDIGLAHSAHPSAAQEPLQFERRRGARREIGAEQFERLPVGIGDHRAGLRLAEGDQRAGRQRDDEVDLRREGAHPGQVFGVLGQQPLESRAVCVALVDQVHRVVGVGLGRV